MRHYFISYSWQDARGNDSWKFGHTIADMHPLDWLAENKDMFYSVKIIWWKELPDDAELVDKWKKILT